jgi:hypothetical protein
MGGVKRQYHILQGRNEVGERIIRSVTGQRSGSDMLGLFVGLRRNCTSIIFSSNTEKEGVRGG